MPRLCKGWCGMCYANRKGRGNFKHHSGYREPRKWARWADEMAIRRPEGVQGVRQGAGGNGGCPLLDLFPTVRDYLRDTSYEDGTPRVTATLLCFVEDGLVKLCLSDRAEGRALWMTGDTVEAACTSLEAALASGRADWRQSKPKGRR